MNDGQIYRLNVGLLGFQSAMSEHRPLCLRTQMSACQRKRLSESQHKGVRA